MPEGPEVKTLVKWLNNQVKNKNLNNIKINFGRYLKHGPPIGWDKLKKSLPLKVKSVNCKGKFIWWEFENSDLSMWNTLGMSGWWYHQDYKHNNLSFKIGHSFIHFNDVRNFGTIKICTKNNLEKKLNCLGPDVLQDDNLEEFKKRLNRKRKDTYIGSALMDQKVISGVGNYLRADILYVSKISPFREIQKLKEKEIELLYKNCRLISERAFKIQNNQKFENDLIHPSMGERFFFIYSKDKDIKGNKVITAKLGTRTVHWVPKVQK